MRVAADLTRTGRFSVLQDGVAAMPPRSRFTTGRRVVVISAPDVPAADAAEVVSVANRELPGLPRPLPAARVGRAPRRSSF